MSNTEIWAINKMWEERRLQIRHGFPLHENHSMEKWFTILVAEVGELANSMTEREDFESMDNVAQVASVCIAWLQNMAERLEDLGYMEDSNG